MLFLCYVIKIGSLGLNGYKQRYLIYDSATDRTSWVDSIQSISICNKAGFKLEDITGLDGVPHSGYLVLGEKAGKDGSIIAYKVFDASKMRVYWVDKKDLLEASINYSGNIPYNYTLANVNNKQILRKKPHAVVESIVYKPGDSDTSIVSDTYGNMPVQSFLKLLKRRKFKECLSFRWERRDRHSDGGNEVLQHYVLYNKAAIVNCTDNLSVKGGLTLSWFGGDMVVQTQTNGNMNVFVHGCSGGMENSIDGKPYMHMSIDIRDGLFSKYNQCEKIVLPKWVQGENVALAYETGCLNGTLGDSLCNDYTNNNYDITICNYIDSLMAGMALKYISKESKETIGNLFKDIYNSGLKASKKLGKQQTDKIKEFVEDKYKQYKVEFIKIK